jgi:hypothetical protein
MRDSSRVFLIVKVKIGDHLADRWASVRIVRTRPHGKISEDSSSGSCTGEMLRNVRATAARLAGSR